MGADKTARDGLLARSALGNVLIGGRFAIWVLGNAAGLASTGGDVRPGLDPWSRLGPWSRLDP
jgi:hypothetical protein